MKLRLASIQLIPISEQQPIMMKLDAPKGKKGRLYGIADKLNLLSL